MAARTVKANASSVLSAPSCADVLARLVSVAELSMAQRNDLSSAIRKIAQYLRTDPAHLPARPETLQRLDCLHHANLGISRKRLQNIRADFLRALTVTDLHRVSGPIPLSPAWRALSERLKAQCGQYGCVRLIRFMRFCSSHGIEPAAVNDDVSAAFLADLEAMQTAPKPYRLYRTVCWYWNQVAPKVEGWPPVRLTVHHYRQPYGLPWSAFPTSFKDETEAWLASLSGDDLWAEFGPRKPLRSRTIEGYRFHVRLFASALVHRGYAPETLKSLANLVELEAFREGLRFFRDRAGPARTSVMFGCATCLRYIAKHWLKVGPAHQEQLGAICRRLHPPKGMTDKNRSRLLQFDNSDRLRALVRFPQEQVAAVRRRDHGSRHEALKVQIALAVELLLMVPALRLGNLANLDLERHIRRTRSRSTETVHLFIPARDVKNRRDLICELPEQTVALLDLYLQEYRPRLFPKPSPFLFPARRGPKVARSLGEQITAHIQKAIGVVINPHLFRHLAAKIYLNEVDDHEGTRQLLNHSSMETTMSYYADQQTPKIIRRYDSLVQSLRAAPVIPNVGDGR